VAKAILSGILDRNKIPQELLDYLGPDMGRFERKNEATPVNGA